MKKLILLLILLILITKAEANIVTGYVYVQVVNEPPEITSLSLTDPYEDRNLVCNVDFKDEKSSITLFYKWYRNGEFMENKLSNTLPKGSFAGNDIITCSITPYDGYQYGQEKNVSVTILPVSITTKVQTGALNLISSKDVTSKDLEGNSITGIAVANIKENPTPLFNYLIYILIVLLFVLTLVNLKRHLNVKHSS
jgi:hypothetical protein